MLKLVVGRRQSSSVTALLVGDAPTVQQLFGSTHHELIYAREIDQALLMLEGFHVDIVIVNVTPILSKHCCRRIRAALGEVRVPIVVVGSDVRGDADEVLQGPLQPHDVLNIVTDITLLHSHVAELRAAKTVRLRRVSGGTVLFAPQMSEPK